MTGGLRFKKGDVISNDDGRFYMVTGMDVVVTLRMTEMTPDAAAPASFIVREDVNDPVFDRFTRLLPEGTSE